MHSHSLLLLVQTATIPCLDLRSPWLVSSPYPQPSPDLCLFPEHASNLLFHRTRASRGKAEGTADTQVHGFQLQGFHKSSSEHVDPSGLHRLHTHTHTHTHHTQPHTHTGTLNLLTFQETYSSCRTLQGEISNYVSFLKVDALKAHGNRFLYKIWLLLLAEL